MKSLQARFWILTASVLISGISQGMLLPVIAIILEQNHISSTINGLHATGIAIGVLLISPFLEAPLRKFGYRPILILGGGLAVFCLLAFPFISGIWFWFFLRILIGIGDHSLHFAAQTWITSSVQPHELGRKLSIYGLSFGIGFMVGPMMTILVQYNKVYPFLLSGILAMLTWILFFFIQNDYPVSAPTLKKKQSVVEKYQLIFKIAWLALLPGFAYGLIESCLSSNFPVYALRMNFSLEQISLIIPAFALGGIITQVPLGVLSDKYGGKRVITWCVAGGIITFILASLVEKNFLLLFFTILLSGMIIASLFSLGLKYMSELVPLHLLPNSNIVYGIFFSLGSITGPSICGFLIEQFSGVSMFVFISIFYTIFLLAFLKPNTVKKEIKVRQ